MVLLVIISITYNSFSSALPLFFYTDFKSSFFSRDFSLLSKNASLLSSHKKSCCTFSFRYFIYFGVLLSKSKYFSFSYRFFRYFTGVLFHPDCPSSNYNLLHFAWMRIRFFHSDADICYTSKTLYEDLTPLFYSSETSGWQIISYIMHPDRWTDGRCNQ